MFGLFRRSAPRPLSDAIRSAIEAQGKTAEMSNPSQLRMVELGGRYSDRKVTYFRVFDPSSTAQRSLDIRRYKDFDAVPALVLRSGHVERDGTVVLTRPVGTRAPDPEVRTRAGRAVPNLDAPVVNGAAVGAIDAAAAQTPTP
jgi:hypothetical protein